MLLDPVRKRLHLRRIQRRDGPIGHASTCPLHEIVAMACHCRFWPCRARWGRPDKEIDHMLLALVHQRCNWTVVQVIEAPTDQRKSLRCQIRDGRGKIYVALKPWFDRMLICREHISKMIDHEGTDMPGHDVLQHVLVYGRTPMYQPTAPHQEYDKGHGHRHTQPSPGPPHGTGVSATGTTDCRPYLL